MFNTQRFEKSTSYIERLGSTYEREILGEAPKLKYAQEAYKIINRLSADKMDAEDALKMREYAYEYVADYEHLSKNFLSYNQSMKAIERCEDGKKPLAFFAASLRNKLAENADSQGFDVEYFTSVGTHLDVMHGVDAYIKLIDRETKTAFTLTIDLSQMDKGNQKADLLMVITPEEKDAYDYSATNKKFDKQALEARLAQEGSNIIQAINSKYSNSNNN